MTGPLATLRTLTRRQWLWLTLWMVILVALIAWDAFQFVGMHLSFQLAADRAFRAIGMYVVARWALGDLLSRGARQWKRRVSRRRRPAKQDGA